MGIFKDAFLYFIYLAILGLFLDCVRQAMDVGYLMGLLLYTGSSFSQSGNCWKVDVIQRLRIGDGLGERKKQLIFAFLILLVAPIYGWFFSFLQPTPTDKQSIRENGRPWNIPWFNRLKHHHRLLGLPAAGCIFMISFLFFGKLVPTAISNWNGERARPGRESLRGNAYKDIRDKLFCFKQSCEGGDLLCRVIDATEQQKTLLSNQQLL